MDLGSNSFLCLITESKDPSSKTFSVLEDLVYITRLAENVQKTGELSTGALMRAAQAFEQFQRAMERHQVDEVRAVTTSAAREASNFDNLLTLGKRYGISIELISGSREAELSFLGAIPEEDQKTSLLLDIGGGSTEIGFYSNESKEEGSKELLVKSLPLGSVRLGEMFVQDWTQLNKDHIEKIEDQTLKTLEVSYEGEKLPPRDWVAVAGTPTTLKAIEVGGFEEDKIHDAELSLDTAKEILDRMLNLPLNERRKIPGLPPKRADVLPVGTSILITLMSWAKIDKVKVSTRGLRYGVAIESLF